MADAMQETDAAIELAQGAIERLKKRSPEHELLQFADAFASMRPPASFCERFGGKHVPEHFRGTDFAAAAMIKNYYDALQAA